MPIASRRADLAPDAGLAARTISRIRAEADSSLEHVLAIAGQTALLDDDALLKRSIRHDVRYLGPLNPMQVEHLKRYREAIHDAQTTRGIHLCIDGIAAGLRNSG